MTNEEIIEELSSRKVSMSMCISVDDCRKSNMAIEKAIESLQENTKLKAEIEQLQSTNAELCEEIAELEKLIPRICETCKYEDLAGTEEPCENCKHCSSWKMKGGTE